MDVCIVKFGYVKVLWIGKSVRGTRREIKKFYRSRQSRHEGQLNTCIILNISKEVAIGQFPASIYEW